MLASHERNERRSQRTAMPGTKSKTGKPAASAQDNRDRIVAMIRLIPRGRVATYGQIARLAGIPKNSRQVGYVLKTLPTGDSVPWFRVVNSKGEISQRGNGESQSVQRLALEEEQVEFDARGRVLLKRFQWNESG